MDTNLSNERLPTDPFHSLACGANYFFKHAMNLNICVCVNREEVPKHRDNVGSDSQELERIVIEDEKEENIEERNLTTPPLEFIDDGTEADIEADAPSTSKASKKDSKQKKKPGLKRKRKKKSPNKKQNTKNMDCSDVFLDGTNRKRLKNLPNKRKKIRKLLTEKDLQEDTLKALRDEEERQKRLLERDVAAKLENSAGISFKLLESENLAPLPYDLSFLQDITSVNNDLGTSTSSDGTNDVIKTDNLQSSTPSSVHELVSVTSLAPVTSQSIAVGTSVSVSYENNLSTSKSLLPSSAQTKPLDLATSTSVQAPVIPQFPLPPAPTVQAVPPFPRKVAVKAQQDVICISSESSGDEIKAKRKQNAATARPIDTICISSGSESSSEDVIFTGTDDNEFADEDPDVNNSGMHVDDALNQPDDEGRVLVNKNRPPGEPEIYLAPRLAQAVKPHQIGGIRFMFDNIVESLEQFKKGSGFGCILAHSMGLGKTLQVISFVDVFLRHTGAKTALCVVPVNTLLNWVGEFEMWLPQHSSLQSSDKANGRGFKVRLLSDAYKTAETRAQVIASWKAEGGVLLMGYEMFRLLTNHKGRKRKKKKKNTPLGGVIETIDLEEEDRTAELAAQIYQNLVNPGPDLIVCDEGHRIKNSHASISQALKQIATRRRIVLTGYPLQNNLLEYWCMVDFVRPSFLGTRQEFSNMFERPICNGQCADSNENDIRLMRFRSHVLHSLLKGFVQRRSHLVLKNSLPPKEEYVLQVRMSSWQKRLYNTFIKQQKDNGSGSMCSSLNPIKAYSICCKIWNHPDVLYRAVLRKTLEEQSNDNIIDMDLDLPESVIESILKKAKRKRDARGKNEPVPGSDGKLVHSVGFSPFGEEKDKGVNYDWAMDMLEGYSPNRLEASGKMVILVKIIEDSISKGDKILVFSQSLTTLTIIEEFLSGLTVPDPEPSFGERKWARNNSYFRLDGNTSSAERERMIQQFNDKGNNKIHLFLLSTRAGCLGINLVGANRVVVFDISWNPCHDAQAVCRVYRYGQKKKCVIYRLICDQTMEKKIYDRQISKQGMSDRVVDELNPVQSLERQDITKLLIYDDAELPIPSLDECEKECNDGTLSETLKFHSQWLTRTPFHHESLLMDCKGSRLTKAEKRAAQKSYEMEKRASSSFNYGRQSYASFYAAAGYPDKNGPAGLLPRSTSTGNRPVANVRPIQSTPYPMQSHYRLADTTDAEKQIISILKKSQIDIKKVVSDRDLTMPGLQTKTLIQKGAPFYVINGVQSVFIGTLSGRIFCTRHKEPISSQVSDVQGPNGQLLTPREREMQIVKTTFNALMRQNNRMRQAVRPPYPTPPLLSHHTFPPPAFPRNSPLSHPLQMNNHPAGVRQEQFGTNLMDMFSSNYYTTMPNSNPSMSNQNGTYRTDSSMDVTSNPVLTNMVNSQRVPNYFATHPAHNSTPELSSLLNMGGPGQGIDPGLGLASPMPTKNDSNSNWLNFLREGELLRSSGLDPSALSHNPQHPQSGNTFSSGQHYVTDQFIADTSLPASASVPADLNLCAIDESQKDILMQ